MSSSSKTAQPEQQYVMRSPSPGERLLAATAHLLILANLPGIFVTAIIFVLSRRGSPYVRHHARSAIRWQFAENFLTIGLLVLFTAIILASGVFGKGQNSGMALDTAYGAGLGIVFVIVFIIAVETIIFGIPAIIGALRALLSGPFRYPVVPANPAPAR